MRRALLILIVLIGCDDELVCEDGKHPVVDVCVADRAMENWKMRIARQN